MIPRILSFLSCVILALASVAQTVFSENTKHTTHDDVTLKLLLGEMPEKKPLLIDTLESTQLDGGIRYKIRYFIESGNPVLDTPDDWGSAYLFIPKLSKGKKTPAIVAMHQDDVYYHIGKSEPAGLMGDSTMHYGKELFERGYIVICPDRFYHADRRKTCQDWGDLSENDYERDFFTQEKRIGVLLSEGRNTWGKEAYDFSRAVDVLASLPEVDMNNVGAIGHSAGANALSYCLFFEPRIKAAVANCGMSEINDYYNYNRPGTVPSSLALPGSVKYGVNTHDYVGGIAPRALFISEGAHQWGDGAPDPHDKNFAQELELFKNTYLKKGGTDIETVLFEENGGRHCFPSGVKEQAYLWLDKHLK